MTDEFDTASQLGGYQFKAPKRPVNRAFLHCSDSDNPAHDDIAVIARWHTSYDPRDATKPWKDDFGKPAVGYHFFIQKDGTLQLGRTLESRPTAQRGFNKGSIAICLSGKNNFQPVQYNTLQHLCLAIHEQLPLVTFHGHCEVNPHKSCPRFAYKTILALDEKGRLT